MENKLVFSLAVLLFGKSRRLRWLAPAIPLAVGAYRLYAQRSVHATRGATAASTASDVVAMSPAVGSGATEVLASPSTDASAAAGTASLDHAVGLASRETPSHADVAKASSSVEARARTPKKARQRKRSARGASNARSRRA